MWRRNDPAEDSEGPTLVEYLKSPEGHDIVGRIVGVVEGIQKATLESGAEQAKLNMKYTHRDRVWALAIQTFVLLVVVGTAAGLRFYDKLDSTTGLLLGTLAGYFFGRRG